jgi:trans-aconitate methyltransferase
MKELEDFSGGWKNKKAFEEQLKLNIRELSEPNNYPIHWINYLNFMNSKKFKKILDVGCGVGAYYELTRLNLPDVEYFGIDYSEEAIEIAKTKWNYTGFACMDYRDLTSDFVADYDILHMSGFISILNNGSDALDFILSLNAPYVFIARQEMTEGKSSYRDITAYDQIKTYAYSLSIEELERITKERGYTYVFEKKELFLTKNK